MTASAVALAADHAGFELKGAIEQRGLEVLDLGTHDAGSVDYADLADALAAALEQGRASRGVLVCGTGIGISIAANRHRHVRAALCHDVTTATFARQHNGANVLALGSSLLQPDVALRIIDVWLSTPMTEARYIRRLLKVRRLEDSF